MPQSKKQRPITVSARDLIIEYIPIRQVIPDPTNARKHSTEQIRSMATSIGEFGFVNPVLVDEGYNLIAGHGRLAAAEITGLNTVPCIRLIGLSPAQKKALALADNKLHDMSTFDPTQVLTTLNDLVALEYNFEITGYTTAEHDSLEDALAAAITADDPADAMPAPGLPVVSRLDDLWLLGAHRLLCANSLEEGSFNKLLGDDRADVVICDMPFNVPINGHVSGLGKAQHREFAFASGEMTSAVFTEFLRTAMTLMARYSADGSLHYQFMDWGHLGEMIEAGKTAYTELKNLVVWNKQTAGMGSLYRSQHELVFVFKNGKAPHVNNVQLGRHGRHRSNVWSYPGLNGFGRGRDELLALHPTVKPVGLLADAIRDSSKRGALVLDPFVGSGSTVLAAERTRRRAAAIEIDPLYVDTAVRRWQSLTGKAAVLADDGRTFSEIEAKRTAGASSDGEEASNG